MGDSWRVMLIGPRRELGVGKELWSDNRAVLPSLCLDYTPIGRPMKQKEVGKQAEERFRTARVSAPKRASPDPSFFPSRKARWCGGGHVELGVGRRKFIPIYVVIQTHSKAGDTMSAPQIACSVAGSARRSRGVVGGEGGEDEETEALSERTVLSWDLEQRRRRQGRASVVQSTLEDARRGRALVCCETCCKYEATRRGRRQRSAATSASQGSVKSRSSDRSLG